MDVKIVSQDSAPFELPDQEIKRPMLTDAAEFAIIREVYFDTTLPTDFTRDTIDPLEALDRMERRAKRKNNAY